MLTNFWFYRRISSLGYRLENEWQSNRSGFRNRLSQKRQLFRKDICWTVP